MAYLQQIWWLEVVGEIDFVFPAGTYSLYFRLHLGKPSSSSNRRDHHRKCSESKNSTAIHGWDRKPVRFQLSTSSSAVSQQSQCYLLDQPGSWVLYHAGDFVSPEQGHGQEQKPMKLKFSMAQIDCTHTKGGLCVDSVVVYPKGLFQPERVVRADQKRFVH